MGIRVPRVTIKADYGDEASFGDLSLLSVGYGLHQAWIYATMFGASSIMGVYSVSLGNVETDFSLAFIVSVVVFGAMLLFHGIADQKLLKYYVSRHVAVIAALLTSIGSMLLALPPFGMTADTVLQIASGIITGTGSSLLIIFWGTAFSRHDAATIVLNSAIAIAISVFVYAIILHHIPSPVGGAVTALLPIAELPFLLAKTPQPYTERDELPVFNPLPIKRGQFILRFGIPTAIFGVALGALRQSSIQTIVPAANASDQMLVLLAACVATVLILITLLALNTADKWNKLFRPLVPFVAVAVFLLPMLEMGEFSMSSMILLAGYMCFEALIWICFGELSQGYRLSPVFVFGIGRGLLALSSLFGSLLPTFALGSPESTPFGSETVVVALLMVMVVAYAMLPHDKEIQELVIPCPLAQAAVDGVFSPESAKAAFASRSDLAAEGEPAAETPKQDDAVERSAETHGAEEAEAPATQDVQTAGAENAEGKDASGAAVSASTKAAEKAEEAVEEAGSSRAAANADPYPVRSSAAQPQPKEEAAPQSSDDLWPDGKRGRFKRKCELVANRYLLSRRETEVLFFLAKGHNATSIQEQLYISEGTTKTHIRHIYRKLDIHSQQELIQIVEHTEVD